MDKTIEEEYREKLRIEGFTPMRFLKTVGKLPDKGDEIKIEYFNHHELGITVVLAVIQYATGDDPEVSCQFLKPILPSVLDHLIKTKREAKS
jgi:hypothetical protein